MNDPNLTGRERRQAFRLPYRTSLDYALADRLGTGRVRDMSSSGLFLETPELFAVGDHLALRLRFRHGRADMAMNGEIRHVGPDGAGIRLVWEEGAPPSVKVGPR